MDTEGARSMLLDRLEERHDGLGNLLASQAREQNVEVVQRYTAILERIAVKPANEKQLADLRDFIEESLKTTVVELQATVADNRRSLAVLEFYRYPLTLEDMGLSWSTLEYPSKVVRHPFNQKHTFQQTDQTHPISPSYQSTLFAHILLICSLTHPIDISYQHTLLIYVINTLY